MISPPRRSSAVSKSTNKLTLLIFLDTITDTTRFHVFVMYHFFWNRFSKFRYIFLFFFQICLGDSPLGNILWQENMEIWNDDQPINFPITFTNPNIFEIFIYLCLVVNFSLFSSSKRGGKKNFVVFLFSWTRWNSSQRFLQNLQHEFP